MIEELAGSRELFAYILETRKYIGKTIQELCEEYGFNENSLRNRWVGYFNKNLKSYFLTTRFDYIIISRDMHIKDNIKGMSREEILKIQKRRV